MVDLGSGATSRTTCYTSFSATKNVALSAGSSFKDRRGGCTGKAAMVRPRLDKNGCSICRRPEGHHDDCSRLKGLFASMLSRAHAGA